MQVFLPVDSDDIPLKERVFGFRPKRGHKSKVLKFRAHSLVGCFTALRHMVVKNQSQKE